MSLIRCYECNGMVSTLATMCPHCGAANRSMHPQSNLQAIEAQGDLLSVHQHPEVIEKYKLTVQPPPLDRAAGLSLYLSASPGEPPPIPSTSCGMVLLKILFYAAGITLLLLMAPLLTELKTPNAKYPHAQYPLLTFAGLVLGALGEWLFSRKKKAAAHLHAVHAVYKRAAESVLNLASSDSGRQWLTQVVNSSGRIRGMAAIAMKSGLPGYTMGIWSHPISMELVIGENKLLFFDPRFGVASKLTEIDLAAITKVRGEDTEVVLTASPKRIIFITQKDATALVQVILQTPKH